MRGVLTSADMHKTEPIFVDVPEGVTDLHVTFLWPKHSPGQKWPNQISVMIFDTNGPRFEISRPDLHPQFHDRDRQDIARRRRPAIGIIEIHRID